ncbi:protein of unknown function [Maridesulfovibrio hydrothermalis AM13 = DSM 14728]|uniref:Uncharacterized protein n=1 Tax=Maridesulfovibrio hydrothermalis AM13 = DSM 14728 TaxID=1121451 RepID=L0R8E2_9BACT|nr:protein of unknown function [Maridesulfovibrio hydrothermalis AM13 = DSM 14728]
MIAPEVKAYLIFCDHACRKSLEDMRIILYTDTVREKENIFEPATYDINFNMHWH